MPRGRTSRASQRGTIMFAPAAVLNPGIALAAIERLGVREGFAKDEEIYGQAEPVERVYRVIKGAVRTTRLLSDGRRQIGEFYLPGDVFGLETGPDHRYSAEALCDCEVLSMKRSEEHTS